MNGDDIGSNDSHDDSLRTTPLGGAGDWARQLLASCRDGAPTAGSVFDLSDPAQSRLGDFLLLELLGEGAFGLVFRARQASLGREVALKLLIDSPLTPAGFAERFREEAQAAARLQHTGIVPVYEVGEIDDLRYIAMGFVRGPSLAQLLIDGPLDPRRAARYVMQAARAVDYAHREGVLHLDLKPANILIDASDQPQIVDFGLARRMDRALRSENAVAAGTPTYMAPEQTTVGGDALSPATDIYALGAVLHELLAGQPPFRARTLAALLEAVRTQAPTPLRELNRALPRELEHIVARCLAKQPEQRYRSARALVDDLAAYLDGRPLAAEPRWRRWRGPLLATALLAALGLALLTWSPWRNDGGGAAPTLAVLPLTVKSGDAADLALAEGFSESLGASLQRDARLHLAPSAAAFALGRQNRAAADLGRDLDASHLLRGELAGDGARLRVHLELVRSTDERVLWAQDFSPERAELFRVLAPAQDAVLAALAQRGAPANANTTVPAQDLYLLGRHYWNLRTPESIARGRAYFEQALALEPDYAAAWAGLADSDVMLYEYGDLPLDRAVARARPAIAHAQALAPDSADGYASEGLLEMNLGRFDKARPALRRAVDLDPANAMTQTWLGTALTYDGDPRSGLAAYDKALALDANNAVAHTYRGIALSLLGREGEARAAYARALSINPDYNEAYWQEALSELQYGRIARTLAKLDESTRRKPTAWTDLYRTWAYQLAGADDLAAQTLAKAELLGSNDLNLVRTRAAQRWARHDYAGAVRGLESSAPPDQLWYWSLLGQAHALAGDEPRAIATTARAFADWDGIGAPFALPLDPLFRLDLLANWAALQRTAPAELKKPDARAAYHDYVQRLERNGVDLPLMDYLRATDAILHDDVKTAATLLQRSLERGFVDAHALERDLAWRGYGDAKELASYRKALALQLEQLQREINAP